MKHVFTFFLLLIFINHFVHAQWIDDPNNPLAICTAANGQSKVHVITDNLGGAFVFWIDARDAVAGTAIYGQHVTVDGSILWEGNGKDIIQTAGKSIVDFKIAAWQDGILISW